jgi:Smg protein
MFEVLVFVYENYWRGDACPQWDHLGRKLSAAGFESDDISQAITWLRALREATDDMPPAPSNTTAESLALPSSLHAVQEPTPGSVRVYTAAEMERMGPECWGFLRFLESGGMLRPAMREIVVERAVACSSDPLSLEDLKIILLMVYWSSGEEPDALVLDELCDDATARIAH